MTSNLGAMDIQRSIGFAGSDLAELNASNEAKINKAVRAHFKPEFINRIDETILFNALSPESIERILDVETVKIRRQMLLNTRQPQHFVFKVQDQVSPSCRTKNSSRTRGPARLGRWGDRIPRRLFRPGPNRLILRFDQSHYFAALRLTGDPAS